MHGQVLQLGVDRQAEQEAKHAEQEADHQKLVAVHSAHEGHLREVRKRERSFAAASLSGCLCKGGGSTIAKMPKPRWKSCEFGNLRT